MTRQAKYKKQKEINKELIDENYKLSDCNGRLLDQVGAATKQVIALETENNKLLDVINNQDVKIADLEKKNAELKAKWLQATDEGTSWAHLKSLERENTELKEKCNSLQELVTYYQTNFCQEG